jgi:hypothetical protein
MEKLVIRMEDLCPEEGTFELGAFPGEKLVLGVFSMRVRKWAKARFGSIEAIQKIIEAKDMVGLSEICYFMLKDKSRFKTEDEFLEAIRSPADQLAIYDAFASAVGIAEPLKKRIDAHLAEEGTQPPNP